MATIKSIRPAVRFIYDDGTTQDVVLRLIPQAAVNALTTWMQKYTKPDPANPAVNIPYFADSASSTPEQIFVNMLQRFYFSKIKEVVGVYPPQNVADAESAAKLAFAAASLARDQAAGEID